MNISTHTSLLRICEHEWSNIACYLFYLILYHSVRSKIMFLEVDK